MLIQDFGERAAECVRLAERAHSEHDLELFIEMARAWVRALRGKAAGFGCDQEATLIGAEHGTRVFS